MNTKIILFLLAMGCGVFAQAESVGSYEINPGDMLDVLVWNEEALSRQVRVRPDGYISIPLAGEFKAGGNTPAALSETISGSLDRFLNDARQVTVTLLALDGNIIYVLGKVNRPGAFPIATPVDVTQALAWAGGLNTFADESDIKVLRRAADNSQTALEFNYSDIKKGEGLDSNIVLRSGDVVIVP